jgi:hypothetical protein
VFESDAGITGVTPHGQDKRIAVRKRTNCLANNRGQRFHKEKNTENSYRFILETLNKTIDQQTTIFYTIISKLLSVMNFNIKTQISLAGPQ